MKSLLCIAALIIVTIATSAEPARKAPKEVESFKLVTGFYSHTHKDSGFDFRIIEVDGSASVAMNPVYLYLVVTNNSSGEDLQSEMVRLPQVSKIQQIRFFDQPHKIQIEALFDQSNESGSKNWTIAGTIDVFAKIENGVLPKTIDVTVHKKQKAEQGGVE